MAFSATIVGNELHLTIPIGPTVCPSCKVAYPHGLRNEGMTEEAFYRSGQQVSLFVGIIGFDGDPESGVGKWGWVRDSETNKSYLLCGKCYAPVEAARRRGEDEAAALGRSIALECERGSSITEGRG